MKKFSTRPSTIAIDLRPLLGGTVSGVTTYIRNLVPWLLRLGRKRYRFLLFVNTRRSRGFFRRNADLIPAHSSVRCVETHIPNRLLNVSLALFGRPRLDRLLGERVDLFFVPDPRPVQLSRGVRRVTTFHDLSFVHLPRMFSWRSRLFHLLSRPKDQAAQSDRVLAVSQFTKDDLIKTYDIPAQKIIVVHEGVDATLHRVDDPAHLAAVRKKYHLPEQFFLSLSTLEPRKNLHTLVRAFQLFRAQTHHDVALVVAGKQDLRIFQHPRLDADHGVFFPGFIASEDKAALFSSALAFLSVSYFEGFGLPLVEAMRCGTPVIAAHAGSLPEVAGRAALFVDPFDAGAIARALEQMTNSDVRALWAQKSLRRSHRFSWKRTAEQTLAVFDHTLSRPA